jgi:GNAT acetyltransferase-like protein
VIAQTCTKEVEWDEFVHRVPWATAHHAFRYGRLLAACFGYLRPAYRVVVAGGQILAGIPLMEFSVSRVFRSLQSLPFDIYGGPLLDPEHLDDPDLHRVISRDVDEQAARIGAFEARFSIPVLAPPGVRRCVQVLGPAETVTNECPVLALDRPLDEIRQHYLPSVRRAVNRSDREGILIEPVADVARIQQVYPFYRARMEQIGATVKPWRFVEGILSEKIGTAFVAYQRERPVGFLILLVTPAIAIYWISAMDPSASGARPMNAMLDAAIAWSHAKGIPRFSFGESHGRPGLVRFKEGWGPGLGENLVMVRTYRPGLQKAWRMLEPVARRSYVLWDRCRSSISQRGVHVL